MKSLSKMFGVIISGALMLAAPGCVVMDLEDPAGEAQFGENSLDTWDEAAEGALDEAVDDGAASGEAAQDEEAGDEGYEALDDADDVPWPDPFDPNKPLNSGSGG